MFETFISVLFLISSFYFLIYCQKRSSLLDNCKVALKDVLHINCLDYSSYYQLTDIPMSTYIILLAYFHENVYVFFIQLGIIQYLRAFSFSMTILPKCSKNEDKDNTRSCSRILFDYITLRDTHTGHNNDLLFSGHVSFIFLFWLYMGHFHYNIYLQVLIGIVNIINSFATIVTRCHYSIDVFYAYVMTYLVFENTINFF
jgi:hypothetical protein